MLGQNSRRRGGVLPRRLRAGHSISSPCGGLLLPQAVRGGRVTGQCLHELIRVTAPSSPWAGDPVLRPLPHVCLLRFLPSAFASHRCPRILPLSPAPALGPFSPCPHVCVLYVPPSLLGERQVAGEDSATVNGQPPLVTAPASSGARPHSRSLVPVKKWTTWQAFLPSQESAIGVLAPFVSQTSFIKANCEPDPWRPRAQACAAPWRCPGPSGPSV